MKTLLFVLSIAGTMEFGNGSGLAADNTAGEAGERTGLWGVDQPTHPAIMFAAAASQEPTEAAGQSSSLRPRQWVKTAKAQLQGAPSPESGFHSPTYLEDVVPILMGKCFRCHNEQTSFLNNWLDYRKAFADRWELRRRIWDSWKGDYFKQPMPTANSPESEAITEEERALIRAWIDAGAAYGVPPKQTNPQSKAERMEVGKRLFTTICAACHQPTGQGIPNRFPPLAGSDFLNSNKERAIRVLLGGLQGEVVVNGMKFNNSMPMLPLTDSDVASALTYVLNSFGNSGQEVTPDEVKAVRGQPDALNGVGGHTAATGRPEPPGPWE
jgi:mono/diheme cytochrome c family protein